MYLDQPPLENFSPVNRIKLLNNHFKVQQEQIDQSIQTCRQGNIQRFTLTGYLQSVKWKNLCYKTSKTLHENKEIKD